MKKRDHQRDPASGLVFLDASRTAESGNLGSFLKTFHDYEFSGLIATEEQTLDSFANPFGLEVLERPFTPGTLNRFGCSTTYVRARARWVCSTASYCPPDLHVRTEEESNR